MEDKTNWQEWLEADTHRRYQLKVLEKLRLELATRVNNEHVGSGLGGNPSQFLFVLSKKVLLEKSPDNQPHFLDGSSGELVLQVPMPTTMKAVRKALDSFYADHPQKNNFTQEQVSNPSFLKDYIFSSTLDIKMLIKALELGWNAASWIDQKGEVLEHTSKMEGKEVHALHLDCLRDLGFPSELLTGPDTDENKADRSRLRSVAEKHPVWGARITAVRKRYGQIFELMISQEDIDKMETMGAFPNYIALFSVRSCIQIERIVKYNFDEKLKFLAPINKTIAEPLDENSDSSELDDDVDDE